ncbi:GDSL-type esterase/lipase family protein [Niabella insulamsoli]|uniref:GDSL-type esterase/lipase family protein n=1 Tax=Niabella insulamsoli TaxID=3144874 RepID=UPI0031FC5719
MNKSIFTALLLLLLFVSAAEAQKLPRFYNDVQRFKQADSASFPPSKQILFIGSSSFTKWTDVNEYFPGYKILNRGFGGSSLPDLIRYRYEVIYPYAPRQIVMYCGENDFAAADAPSVETVMERFKTLYHLIRQKYPKTPFVYVSMKPSPSRQHLLSKYKEANAQIAAFLKQDKNAGFIDVFSRMLNSDGTVMTDIFVSDNLHMNAKGYAIWQKAMKPYLKK